MMTFAADVWSHWSLGRALDGPAEMVSALAAAGYRAALLADVQNLNGALQFRDAARALDIRPLIGVSVPLADGGRTTVVRVVACSASGWPVLCELAVPGPPRSWDAVDWPGVLVLVPGGIEPPRGFGTPVWGLAVDPGRDTGRVPPLAAVPIRYRDASDRFCWEVLGRMVPAEGVPADGGPPVPAEAVLAKFGYDHPAVRAWDEVLAAVDREVVPSASLKWPDRRGANGESPVAELRRRAAAGLAARLGAEVPSAYVDRLARELDTIAGLSFAEYFLVVADLVDEARRRSIAVGPGRGSAAASLVAYALGITQIDPLKHGLVFERFLNPHRRSPPDIDLDIEDTRRSELVRHLAERHGPDRVAHIGSYATLGVRAAWRETARVMGIPTAVVDRTLRAVEAGRTPAPADDRERQWHRAAERLRGTPHHASVHAAGVVVGPSALTQWTPVLRTEDQAVTGLDMHGVAALGLIKFDLLGLRTLTAIRHAVALADPPVPDMSLVPDEDAETIQLLRRGDTEGIFQLDGRGVRDLLRAMAPQGLADVMLAVALFRPGPMDHIGEFLRRRRDGFVPAAPLDRLLHDTAGILVYQEQLMAVARELAGYDWAEADLFRQAISKKDRALLEAERRRFLERAAPRVGGAAAAEALWEQILPFAQYGFNRAHAAAYGLVAYYAAYLKAHAPAAFWAGEMATRGGGALMATVAAAMREGLAVHRPHVNLSSVAPSVVRTADGEGARGQQVDGIRLGLAGIRGVTPDTARAIVAHRPPGGYRDAEALRRALGNGVPTTVWTQLAAAGALEGLGPAPGRDQIAFAFGGASPAAPDSEEAWGAQWPEPDGRVYVQVEAAGEWAQAIVDQAARCPGDRELVAVVRGQRQGRRLGPRVAGTAAARRVLLQAPGVISALVGVRTSSRAAQQGGHNP